MMLRAIILRKHCNLNASSVKELLAANRFLHSSPCYLKSALEVLKDKERSVEPEPRPLKVKMEPYVKNLFRGRIDKDIFGFLDLDLGSLNIIEDMSSEIEKVMKESITSSSNQGKISTATISHLKDLGILKANIPLQYGGMDLSCAEMLRLCEEFSKDPAVFHTLNVHLHYICSLFTNFASDEQKDKYLPLLASGDLQIGFALWETNAGVDVSTLDCHASFRGDCYVLSGTKRWVCNGGIADKFVVFANEKKGNHKGNPDEITCFLVDKNADGVSAKSMDTMGMEGYNAWEVTFSNTAVPKENVIGQSGQGISILRSLLHGKFTLAGSNVGLLRDLLNTTVRHAINKETFGKPLIEHEMVRMHLAQAATRLYALESIAYMTADLYDNIEDPDIELEVAIVKLYSSETLTWMVQTCLTILGSDSYLRDKPYEKILRDSLFSPLVETSRDTLRMTIAMLGLRHVGKIFQESVFEKRNPLFYPSKKMKGFFENWLMETNEPGFKKVIFHHVHPSLELGANRLENSILKFGSVVEDALAKWGKDIETKHKNLSRVSDIAVDLYISTAALARASRALSIGTRLPDVDLNMAFAITYDASERINRFAEDIEISPYSNNDSNYYMIANSLVHERKYHADHPLTRTF